ncbi:MAG: hypothetical protein K9M54_05085 [Kiritimatiellales bacterium]|nr:hypothetical protein [Kiritimatiellales bacterium]MCF7864059.1 hypothetical protein [Kiritimatiellales bacterium]
MHAIRNLSILILVATLTLAATAEPKAGSIGSVVATENAESYTYVQLDIAGEKIWFAAPALDLKPGDQVVVPAGMPMKDFHSKTLDRTFDVVYFVDAIPLATAPEATTTLPPGHPPIQAATACPAPAPAPLDFSGIEKPEGGKTVAEIHQESAALSGKQIVVRGKAVKVSNSIMGKNWIHLRDGTGDANSNDLTVTTTNSVELGATITASGILATDRDFGSGYKYAVLLEDAAIETN